MTKSDAMNAITANKIDPHTDRTKGNPMTIPKMFQIHALIKDSVSNITSFLEEL